jgi:hypothetical protein
LNGQKLARRVQRGAHERDPVRSSLAIINNQEMRNIVKKIVAAVGLSIALMSTSAFASWSNPFPLIGVEIDGVTTGNGTTTYLTVAANTAAGMPACSTKLQFLVKGSPDHVKAITALATSAFLSGHYVRVNFEGTCTSSGYAFVDNLLISPTTT